LTSEPQRSSNGTEPGLEKSSAAFFLSSPSTLASCGASLPANFLALMVAASLAAFPGSAFFATSALSAPFFADFFPFFLASAFLASGLAAAAPSLGASLASSLDSSAPSSASASATASAIAYDGATDSAPLGSTSTSPDGWSSPSAFSTDEASSLFAGSACFGPSSS